MFFVHKVLKVLHALHQRVKDTQNKKQRTTLDGCYLEQVDRSIVSECLKEKGGEKLYSNVIKFNFLYFPVNPPIFLY